MIPESSEPGFISLVDASLRWWSGSTALRQANSNMSSSRDRLEVAGRDLMRRLLQDHLDLRAHREARLAEVVAVGGVRHGTVEAGHIRGLGTVFGQVAVPRLAYRSDDRGGN